MRNRLSAAALLLIVPAARALAEDAPAPAPASPENYRWAIYTSCTVAFVAIAIYLVITHKRAGAASEEMDAIERRLEDLEKDAR